MKYLLVVLMLCASVCYADEWQSDLSVDDFEKNGGIEFSQTSATYSIDFSGNRTEVEVKLDNVEYATIEYRTDGIYLIVTPSEDVE